MGGSSTERGISITADSSQAIDSFDRLSQSGHELYNELKDGAAEATESLQDQSRQVRELLNQERARLEQLREEQRLRAEMRAQDRLEQGGEDREVQRERVADLRRVQREHGENMHVYNEARRRYEDDDWEDEGGGGGGGSGGGRRGGRRRGGRLRSVGSSVAQGVGQGMGLGAILSLSGLIGNLFSEGTALDQGTKRLFATTGKHGAGGLAGIGIKTADSSVMAAEYAKARGVTGEGFNRDFMMQSKAEKAFNLGRGSLNSLSSFERMGSNSSSRLLQQTLKRAADSDLWNIGKGDFSSLEEKMGNVETLMKRESEISENFSGLRSIELQNKFSTMGGGWADSRGLGRMQALDQSIRNPGNEYMQAEVMKAVSGGNPGMDLLGVRQQMQKGIYGKDNLYRILSHFQSRFGKGSRLTQTALGAFTPDLLQNPEALAELSNVDASKFRGLGEDELKASFGEMGLGKYSDKRISGRAGAATGITEKINARISNSLGRVGISVEQALEKPINSLISWAEKSVVPVFEWMASFLKNPNESIGSLIGAVVDQANPFMSDEEKAIRRDPAQRALNYEWNPGWGANTKSVGEMNKGRADDMGMSEDEYREWSLKESIKEGSKISFTPRNSKANIPMSPDRLEKRYGVRPEDEKAYIESSIKGFGEVAPYQMAREFGMSMGAMLEASKSLKEASTDLKTTAQTNKINKGKE